MIHLSDLRPRDHEWLQSYLEQFGYLLPNELNDEDAVSDALLELQRLLDLPVTGQPDCQTLRALRMTPRCGCSDAARMGAEDARWRKTDLTYRIVGWVGGLSQDVQRALLREAWDSWQAVADITLTETTDARPDIVIDVGQGRGDNFDGAQGTLAWAYLPPGNDSQLLMKFDLAESWTASPAQRGILFKNVACHEFGHLLGLDHSKAKGALMAPFYAPAVDRPQPHDDVTRIQGLYGPPRRPPEPPTTPPSGRETIIRIKGDVQSIEIPGYRVLPLETA